MSIDSARRTGATRLVGACALAASLLATTACGSQPAPIPQAVERPTTLVLSEVYRPANDPTPVDLQALQSGIHELRSTTSSGWVGTQDDVTGHLGELSGGRFPGTEAGAVPDDVAGTIDAFLNVYGERLFGIQSGDVSVDVDHPSAPDDHGVVTLRSRQVMGDVPVRDGQLVFAVGTPTERPRLHSIRGRVFPGLSVDTKARLTADEARSAAGKHSGGAVQSDPELVVIPEGEGVLAWQVSVAAEEDAPGGVGISSGLYYIDASSGELLEIRPAAAHSTTLMPLLGEAQRADRTPFRLPAAPRRGKDVTISGKGPHGTSYTAHGVRTDQGVRLDDTTVSTYDPETGNGGVYTYTAEDKKEAKVKLPGKPYVQRSGTTITDPDAIAGHALARMVVDAFATLFKRSSWDGFGGSTYVTVNFDDAKYCNAFFNAYLNPPQMVFGNPCSGPSGKAEFVVPDIAGHEITHGVTATTSGLNYTGQSGALNESFSDYFGTVISNRHTKRDDAAVGIDACKAVKKPQQFCDVTLADGRFATRDMLNGNRFSDYLHVMDLPYRMQLLGYSSDNGGVHMNSAIWNNALWSIRSRLAKMDRTSGNASRLARQFDQSVYQGLIRLTPDSGFVDARRAVEQAIVSTGADPAVLRVARETFQLSEICADCTPKHRRTGIPLTTGVATELAPSVHDDLVIWVDPNGRPGGVSAQGPRPARSLGDTTVGLVFGGDATITLEYGPKKIVRHDEGGRRTVLGSFDPSTPKIGLGGSDEGAAWASAEDGTVSYVDEDGQVTTRRVPDADTDNVVALSAGDGSVGLGTERGRVLLWKPGGAIEQVGKLPGAVLATATYGDRVLAVDDELNATAFDADGSDVRLPRGALPFGAAMNEDFAVWTQATGSLRGGIADAWNRAGAVFPDTDLFLYSFETGRTQSIIANPGQQGFPGLSGNRLVWQDTSNRGNDILTAVLKPSG